MSLDVYSVKLVPYPVDIHPYDVDMPQEMVAYINPHEPIEEDGMVDVVWITEKDAMYLNSIVNGTAVPHTLFKFYDIERYAKAYNIQHNGFYIDGDHVVLNIWDDYVGIREHRVLASDMPLIPEDNNGDKNTYCFIVTSGTIDGGYSSSIFKGDHPDREFYSKADLPEFLKFCHDDCQHIFGDLADDEVVWMNY